MVVDLEPGATTGSRRCAHPECVTDLVRASMVLLRLQTHVAAWQRSYVPSGLTRDSEGVVVGRGVPSTVELPVGRALPVEHPLSGGSKKARRAQRRR